MNNRGSNALRGGPSGTHRPLAPSSSLQSLIPRPSDYNKNTSFFSSNQFLDRLSKPSGLRDSVIQSTPLIQRFAQESDGASYRKQNNQQRAEDSQLSQPFSVASASQIGNDRLSVRQSSLGAFLNAPPVVSLREDPRELSSPEWQRRAMGKLFEVLTATEFVWHNPKHQFAVSHVMPISKHTLEKVFEHFMRTLLFEYTLEDKKFEDEVAKWARQLGYPYHHMLKKNTLSSPNISSAVPVVCGFLDWMRETMEIWLSLINRESKFGTIFKFHNSDIDEDLSIEGCFHKLRMGFVVEAYQRSGSGRTDVEDLIERFVQQLYERYGDQKTKNEALEKEMEERKAALAERVGNYESLGFLNTKYDNLVKSRAQTSEKTVENQKVRDQAEKEFRSGEEILEAKRMQAANLQAEIAKVKQIIQCQPLKKDQLNGYKRKIVNETKKKVRKLKKMAEAEGLFQDQEDKEEALSWRIEDLISNLQPALAELSGMATSGCPVSFPVYDDSMEIKECIRIVRAVLEQAVDSCRKQLEEMGDSKKQQDMDLLKLSEEENDRKKDVKRFEAEMNELQSASTAMAVHLEQQLSNDVPALLDEKNRLTQDLSKLEANLANLKTRLEEVPHTRLSKEATVKKLQALLARYETESARKMEQFRQKQEERIANVENVAVRIDNADQKTKRVKRMYVREMVDAVIRCKEEIRGSME